MNKEEIYENGVPGTTYDENPNDYIVGSDTEIKIPSNNNQIKNFYNQAAQTRTRNACGLYASAGCISDYTGYLFSTKELLEIVDLAEKDYEWKENGGMYMSRAVDCVRNWWNKKFPEKKLMTFNLRVGTGKYLDALSKGHSLAIGYHTGVEYLKDSQDNGIIEIETYQDTGGGHLVRCAYDKNNFLIRDNYFGKKKFNSYTNNKIELFRKKGLFFPSAYIFLFEDQRDIKAQEERIASEIEKKILEDIEAGTKRIVIYDTLKKEGYTEKNILNGMAKVFGVHAEF